MVPPCQLCGHVGYEELLVYCNECRVSAQHSSSLFSQNPNPALPKPNFQNPNPNPALPKPKSSSSLFNRQLFIHFDSTSSSTPVLSSSSTPLPPVLSSSSTPLHFRRRRLHFRRRRRQFHFDSTSDVDDGSSTSDIVDSTSTPLRRDSSTSTSTTSTPLRRRQLHFDSTSTSTPLQTIVESPQVRQRQILSGSTSFEGSEYSLVCEECKPRFPRTLSSEKLIDCLKSSNFRSHGKTVELQMLQTDVPDVSQPEMMNGDNSPCTPSEQGEKRQSKRRRRILLEENLLEQEYQLDHGDENVINKATDLPTKPPLSSSQQSRTCSYDEVTIGSQIAAVKDHDAQSDICSFYAEPIIDHVWSGEFSFENEKYGPFVAHASSKAHIRVSVASKRFPAVLDMEKLWRHDSWPNSFKNAPPTDESIGLFFFSGPGDDTLFDRLVKDIIDNDLMLKFVFDEAELLIFSSIVLPRYHHRFQSKYYLWGTFRRRQVPALTSTAKSNCNSQSDEIREEVSKLNLSDKGERDECIYDDSDFHSSPSPRASDVIQNSADNSSDKLHESEYLSGHARQKCNDLNSNSNELKTNQIQGTKLGVRNGDQLKSEIELQSSPSPKASDVTQNSPKYSSPKVDGSEYQSKHAQRNANVQNSISNEVLSDIQKINQIHVSELRMKKSTHSESDVELEEGEIFELEEGEILDERVGREEGEFCFGDYEEGRCLRLFPLGVEDMGIVARCGGGTELNLDLGLS